MSQPNNPKVALVGGESLLGQDVREVFRERLPHVRIDLVGSRDSEILTEEAGEAVVMTGLDGDTLAEADVIAGWRPGGTRCWVVSMWIWLVADNFRVSAINAAKMVESAMPVTTESAYPGDSRSSTSRTS